jgi:hypothetical protein
VNRSPDERREIRDQFSIAQDKRCAHPGCEDGCGFALSPRQFALRNIAV